MKAFDPNLLKEANQSKCDINVEMFLQSFKYFIDDFKGEEPFEILKLFQFNREITRRASEILIQLRNKYQKNGKAPVIIGIHVRRSMLAIWQFDNSYFANLFYLYKIFFCIIKYIIASGRF